MNEKNHNCFEFFFVQIFFHRFQTLCGSYTFKGIELNLLYQFLVYDKQRVHLSIFFSAGLEVQLLQQGGAQVVPLYPGMEDVGVSACSSGCWEFITHQSRRWWVGKVDVALERD